MCVCINVCVHAYYFLGISWVGVPVINVCVHVHLDILWVGVYARMHACLLECTSICFCLHNMRVSSI